MGVTMVDVRTAALRSFRRFLEGLTFELAGKQWKFAKVHDSWPDFNKPFKVPAASLILVRAEIESGPMTPFVASEKVNGTAGSAIFQKGEWVAQLQIDLWTETIAGMDSVMRALQDALNPDATAYGLLLFLDDYFEQQARFTYESEQPNLDEASVAGNQFRTTVTVTVEVPYMVEKKGIAVLEPRVGVESGDDQELDGPGGGVIVGGR
jgi:hypothetical protein